MVKAFYEKEFNLTWLKPSGINNGYAIVVRPETAKEFNLKTLSDLGKASSKLRLGAGTEFVDRRDGITGLKEVYGARVRRVQAVRGAAPALRGAEPEADRGRQRLLDRLADRGREVRRARRRQGAVPALFPGAGRAPRDRRPTRRSSAILEKVGAALDNPTMQELNRQVEVDKKEPRDGRGRLPEGQGTGELSARPRRRRPRTAQPRTIVLGDGAVGDRGDRRGRARFRAGAAARIGRAAARGRACRRPARARTRRQRLRPDHRARRRRRHAARDERHPRLPGAGDPARAVGVGEAAVDRGGARDAGRASRRHLPRRVGPLAGAGRDDRGDAQCRRPPGRAAHRLARRGRSEPAGAGLPAADRRGRGRVRRHGSARRARPWRRPGIALPELGPKDGLALLNANAQSVGLAALAADALEQGAAGRARSPARSRSKPFAPISRRSTPSSPRLRAMPGHSAGSGSAARPAGRQRPVQPGRGAAAAGPALLPLPRAGRRPCRPCRRRGQRRPSRRNSRARPTARPCWSSATPCSPASISTRPSWR